MNAKQKIIEEIENVPEEIIYEVLDFLLFLKAKEDLEDLEDAKAALKEAQEVCELRSINCSGCKKTDKKLPYDVQKKVIAKLEELTFEPRIDGLKKLECSDNLYRVRLEKYRIIYEIQDGLLLVMVIKIKHRSDVYRL